VICHAGLVDFSKKGKERGLKNKKVKDNKNDILITL
jgi:hypothetical protein